ACQEFGVRVPKTPSSTSLEREMKRQNILDALRQGLRTVEICRKFGVVDSTVSRIIMDYGFKRGAHRADYQIPVLAELINTTRTQRDIADQFGIDPAEVTRIAKESLSASIKLHPKRRLDRVNRGTG